MDGEVNGRSRGKRPTIRDIATAAGVSRTTVSRVLNGGLRVSPEALHAVQDAIARTGYSANRHARALSAGRSNTVAFLFSEPQQRLFEDPNLSTLLREVARALNGLPEPPVLVLVVADLEADQDRMLDFLTEQVDGVFVISSHRGDPLVAKLLEAGVPLVAAGRPLGHSLPAASVSADDAGGARIAVTRLRSLGRRRIGTITGPLDTSGGADRLAGYCDAMAGQLDERLVVNGDWSYGSGAEGMRRLLELEPEIDGVFVASDLMAAGALSLLRQVGRRVPEDVAVVGFDDSSYATAVDPPLTTVAQPWDRISAEMVRLLMSIVGGAEPISVSIPTRLVVRDSA